MAGMVEALMARGRKPVKTLSIGLPRSVQPFAVFSTELSPLVEVPQDTRSEVVVTAKSVSFLSSSSRLCL